MCGWIWGVYGWLWGDMGGSGAHGAGLVCGVSVRVCEGGSGVCVGGRGSGARRVELVCGWLWGCVGDCVGKCRWGDLGPARQGWCAGHSGEVLCLWGGV